ncbi:hypothetical protein FQB35_01415 [Crassaminicella thermophila]|uniref:Uncharacterized protein n=1 Tax=Crassaminicella thermophila TaxID=2599308 RepID=A0A5C0SBR6_CRATE|nr:hypothetical protein [Crassaminicella thermophila]QEK11126.1 hypothetical protein FQB35_01415 [Crassaminicella thermophila]
MKITKKMYEEYLNTLGVPKADMYENGGRCRGKKYGTWLRRNDKEAFDIGYNAYVEKLKSKENENSKTYVNTNKALFDYSQSKVIREIIDILKEENIEKECHVLLPKQHDNIEYKGQSPLVMISSEVESSFIAEFINESIPKDKYFLSPCSTYMLGVYPTKII